MVEEKRGSIALQKKKSPTEISSWQRQKLHSGTFQIWIFAPIVFSAIKKVINITFILLRYIKKRKSGAQHFCIVFLLLGRFTFPPPLPFLPTIFSLGSQFAPFLCLCRRSWGGGAYTILTGLWSGRKRLNHCSNTHSTASFSSFAPVFVWDIVSLLFLGITTLSGLVWGGGVVSILWWQPFYCHLHPNQHTAGNSRETTCCHISSSCTRDITVL